jgi:hypothetical protein
MMACLTMNPVTESNANNSPKCLQWKRGRRVYSGYPEGIPRLSLSKKKKKSQITPEEIPTPTAMGLEIFFAMLAGKTPVQVPANVRK